MIVGFTGTRVGLTEQQFFALHGRLLSLEPTSVRHGCAIGADNEFDKIAAGAGIRRTLLPAKHRDSALQECLHRKPELILETEDPDWDTLRRNRKIVVMSNHLLACPEGPETVRSGTWSTIRFAKTIKMSMTVVHPDGSLQHWY